MGGRSGEKAVHTINNTHLLLDGEASHRPPVTLFSSQSSPSIQKKNNC